MEVIRQFNVKDLKRIVDLRLKINSYDLRYIDSNSIVLNQKEYTNKVTSFKLSNMNEKAINMYKSFVFTNTNHIYTFKVQDK